MHWAPKSAEITLKSKPKKKKKTPQVHLKPNLSAESQAETFLDQSENESAEGVTGFPESWPINSEGPLTQGHSIPCT